MDKIFTGKKIFFFFLVSFFLLDYSYIFSGSLKHEQGTNPAAESMNGTAERIDRITWKVVPRDDLDTNEAANHRCWWYVRLDAVDTDSMTTINVSGDGWNGVRYAPPVFSYDGKNWQAFGYSDVTRILKDKIGNRNFFKYSLKKHFKKSTVWVARYYPYTYTRLNELISGILRSDRLKIDTIGLTSLGRPIRMLTISDFRRPDTVKKRIIIHARTHPAESGSSFIVEGIVRYLLSSDCKADLGSLIFNIVPMLNIDGVIAGNSRLSAEGINLEEAWIRDDKEDYIISPDSPPEVKALNAAIRDLRAKGPEIIAAINLHTLNPLSYIKPFPFAFSNFSNWEKYKDPGKSLWIKQTTFVKFLNEEYCTPVSMRRNPKTTSTIDKKKFPESWWWVNFKDSIMAITLEASPEKTCCNEFCLGYDAHEIFGQAIVKSLYKYYLYAKGFGFSSAPEDTDLEELMQYWDGVDMEEQIGK